MDMNELFSELMKSNNSKKEWSPEMEDRRNTRYPESIGKLNSYLLDLVREERKTKIHRTKAKPQSKYHK